jgi:hypothetical protein
MEKRMKTALLMLASALVLVAGCRSAAEFMGFTGRPEGNSGWSHDFEAPPQDVYEAFRLVVRDNGVIESESPEEFSLRGLYKPHDSRERDGINLRGRVYDHSSEAGVRSRLIVHAWYARAATDRDRQDLARSYCNSVHRVLQQWRGDEPEAPTGVTTTSEEPLAEDEAVGYFSVTQAEAIDASRKLVEQYGSVDQLEANFIRGRKHNPLEPHTQEVRVWVYDRTEQDRVRVKLSVRVRDHENRPLPEVARAYVAEIRKELERRLGEQD